MPPALRVTGPLLWERPFEPVEPPPGDDPLVLVAPSTSQDPDQRMVRAALAGLADQPVRVLATLNHRPSPVPLDVPANARVVDWLSYARTMPHVRGRGLPRRARHRGPRAGQRRAGRGLSRRRRHGRERRPAGVVGLRRLAAAPVRHRARGAQAAVRKLLADPGYAERAGELGAWAERHDGAAVAADAVEELAVAHPGDRD